MSAPTSPAKTFRLPRTAYIAVVFLLVGAVPLAFGDNTPRGLQDSSSGAGVAGVVLGPRLLVLLVPVLAAAFIARTATFVTEDGVRVRAVFGSRRLPWTSMRGLSVSGRSVYAVLEDGSIRLPCVRTGDLAGIARASGGRLPEIAEPTPKYAPSRRRRR